MSGFSTAQLRKFVAPELVFGAGSRLLAGKYAGKMGADRILLVSDAGVAAAGWTEELRQAIVEAGLLCHTYIKVSPNPRDFEIMGGAQAYREADCNGIVVIGGGSAIDCAKGIAIVAANGGNILDFEGVDTVQIPVPPLICVPTTAGTGADVSQFAIILSVAERNKIAIISKMIVPDVSLVDPEPTLTMEPFLTACTGVDALTHAVEAICSNASSPLTDVHAEYAIRLVYHNLPRVIANPSDMEARSNMTLGCMAAGLAFSNASLGAVHAMAHSLGGYLDLPHGECNAILLSHVLDYNFSAARQQCERIAACIDLDLRGLNEADAHRRLIDEVNRFRSDAGIGLRLGDLGVRTADLPELAEHALADPCLVTNPREAGRGDLEAIYGEAI